MADQKIPAESGSVAIKEKDPAAAATPESASDPALPSEKITPQNKGRSDSPEASIILEKENAARGAIYEARFSDRSGPDINHEKWQRTLDTLSSLAHHSPEHAARIALETVKQLPTTHAFYLRMWDSFNSSLFQMGDSPNALELLTNAITKTRPPTAFRHTSTEEITDEKGTVKISSMSSLPDQEAPSYKKPSDSAKAKTPYDSALNAVRQEYDKIHSEQVESLLKGFLDHKAHFQNRKTTDNQPAIPPNIQSYNWNRYFGQIMQLGDEKPEQAAQELASIYLNSVTKQAGYSETAFSLLVDYTKKMSKMPEHSEKLRSIVEKLWYNLGSDPEEQIKIRALATMTGTRVEGMLTQDQNLDMLKNTWQTMSEDFKKFLKERNFSDSQIDEALKDMSSEYGMNEDQAPVMRIKPPVQPAN